jgi:tripartite-type tricarboxylate transporter receptor subunit TctC
MIGRRQFARMLAALPFAFARISAAKAETYPDKPIRFVVPFPAGGSTDVGIRVIAQNLTHTLGQQAYVENKSGANGGLGIEEVERSAPDGYTLLGVTDAVASNPHVYHLSADPSRDLVAIIQVSRQPIVLAAHPSLGVNSIAELIALVKQQPGLPYATGSGVGSGQAMAAQWFAKIAGIALEQIAYRGGGQAINDLIAGHVKLGSLGSTPLIPHYKAGTLRLLAQTTKARSPSLPDIPTFEEAGIKGLVLDQWIGVFAPAGTPSAITEELNSEIGKVLAEPMVKGNFLDSAQEAIGGTAEQFANLVRDDYAKYGRLVKELNIKVE